MCVIVSLLSSTKHQMFYDYLSIFKQLAAGKIPPILMLILKSLISKIIDSISGFSVPC